ncbi:MAG TPA: AIM24 family protein, partial [Pyrinomonadaceae bacterium]|nr:AIM24 family protein [Pyrinomonadaceae bacterium]
MSDQKTHTCPWCGLVTDASTLSCPSCGATIDAREVVTESGWAELPGRKDMAKLQFGDSFCQIEGNYVPVADMSLSAQDWIYFAHHVLLWKDPQVTITAMSLKGAWKRLLSGMPLVMTQAQGPGHIAFSRDAPGEM